MQEEMASKSANDQSSMRFPAPFVDDAMLFVLGGAIVGSIILVCGFLVKQMNLQNKSVTMFSRTRELLWVRQSFAAIFFLFLSSLCIYFTSFFLPTASENWSAAGRFLFYGFWALVFDEYGAVFGYRVKYSPIMLSIESSLTYSTLRVLQTAR